MFPPLPVVMPPATPSPGGLLDAATIVTQDPPRHDGGLTLISPNHPAHGVWPTGCGDTHSAGQKTGHHAEPTLFPGTIVWASDECATVGISPEELATRAENGLSLTAPIEIEKQVASQLVKIEPGPAATNLVEAVARVEAAISADGYTGVIHAPRGLLAYFQAAKMIIRQGGRLFTPGGHRWAFGTGYGDLSGRIVGTGPVIVYMSTPTVTSSTDPRRNRLHVVAEQTIAAGWDTPTIAVPLPTSTDPHERGPLTPGETILPGPTTIPGEDTH